MDKIEKKIVIPPALINEFIKHPRFKAVGPGNGTKPADLKVFEQVILETLNSKEFQKQMGKVLAQSHM